MAIKSFTWKPDKIEDILEGREKQVDIEGLIREYMPKLAYKGAVKEKGKDDPASTIMNLEYSMPATNSPRAYKLLKTNSFKSNTPDCKASESMTVNYLIESKFEGEYVMTISVHSDFSSPHKRVPAKLSNYEVTVGLKNHDQFATDLYSRLEQHFREKKGTLFEK